MREVLDAREQPLSDETRDYAQHIRRGRGRGRRTRAAAATGLDIGQMHDNTLPLFAAF